MLYIIGTPIGNLREISFRAIETLQKADVVACEDTRRTALLLNHYEIKKPLISYHKYSESEKAEGIVALLEEGKEVALVSDAGMPLISDPGGVLVSKLIEKNLPYTVISGPCALINALILSGLDASRFLMVGFLPEKQSEKKKLLDKFKNVEATLIFYTPPHDVMKNLDFLYLSLGARKAAVVREISKMFEESVRFQLGAVPQFTLKGEMVIVVEKAAEKESHLNSLTIEQHVSSYMRQGLSKMDAVKKTAADRKIPKSEVYNRAVEL